MKKKQGKKLEYVIVRCQKAGVHAGYLVAEDDKGFVRLKDSRRLWYWKGAATLSEVAVYGAKDVAACRFAVKLPSLSIPLTDVGEIIACQKAGQKMIEKQPEWRA